MIELERYNLGTGIHKVKIMAVELVEIKEYKAIKIDVLNNINGGRECLIFLTDRILLSNFVNLKYDVDLMVEEKLVYEIDENDFVGLIVYINLEVNDKGYLVLDDITDEAGYIEYLENSEGR